MRLVMMGTGLFAEPIFQALLDGPHPVVGLVTQPDRAIGKERGSTRQTGRGLKEIAQERGLPVLQPESINTPEGVLGLQAWRPDLLIVAAYGQILAKEVLAAATWGGINVHASLLPKYRGAAPIAWAIHHGEIETGVTIIKMSISLDAGDLLAQESVAIGPDETAGELESRLSSLGAQLAMGVINQISEGKVRGVKQDPALVTKAPKLTKEHGVIDWHRSPRAVINHIRAMQPWPTPYTILHRPGQDPMRLIVLKAAPFQSSQDNFVPCGELLHIDQMGTRLLVAVGKEANHPGQGIVDILEIQPAGKRRMAAADFLRGQKCPPGSRLGPAA